MHFHPIRQKSYTSVCLTMRYATHLNGGDALAVWSVTVGLLRLKRRYRVLLQMNRLRKAIKDPQNGRYMDTMKSVCHRRHHCQRYQLKLSGDWDGLTEDGGVAGGRGHPRW